jgi:hypothetical protein
MINETEKEKKVPVHIMMEPACHLRLKIAAVSEGKTMGRTILGMLDKCYPLDVSQRLSLALIEEENNGIYT